MTTARVMHRRREDATRQHIADHRHQALDFGPQRCGDDHFPSAAGAMVKDRADRDSMARHFLQTEGLSRKLDVVVLAGAARSMFIFDWIGRAIGISIHARPAGRAMYIYSSRGRHSRPLIWLNQRAVGIPRPSGDWRYRLSHYSL